MAESIDGTYHRLIQPYLPDTTVEHPSFPSTESTASSWWGKSGVTRSQTIENEPDSDGWRSPSPYSLTDEYEPGWEGVYQEWETYRTQDKLTTLTGELSSLERPGIPSWVYPSNNMRARAEVEALNKLSSFEVNYGVAMAEATKSVSLVTGNLKSLYRGLKSVKRGRFAEAARHLGVKEKPSKLSSKDVAGRWLELQYGWIPLMSDIYGACKDAESGLLKAGSHIHVTRNIKSRVSESSEESFHNLVPVRFKHTGVYGYKVRLDYRITDAWLANAGAGGILNPTEVLWELVPFSFVVDWAIPVGNWLNAMGAGAGLSFKGGSHTSYVRQQASRHAYWKGDRYTRNPSTGKYYGEINMSQKMEHFTMNRGVYHAPPFPTPYAKSPFSVAHGLNAVALMRAIF